MQLRHVPVAVGGGVEPAARTQDAPYFLQRLRDVGHVVKHVVGQHHVEGVVFEGQSLCVGGAEDETTVIYRAGRHQVGPRLIDHAGRQVGQGDLPGLRHAPDLVAPQARRPAAQIQHARDRRH